MTNDHVSSESLVQKVRACVPWGDGVFAVAHTRAQLVARRDAELQRVVLSLQEQASTLRQSHGEVWEGVRQVQATSVSP